MLGFKGYVKSVITEFYDLFVLLRFFMAIRLLYIFMDF